MRFAAPIAALLLSSQAYAGGIGPLVIGGFHTEPLYFYSKLNADGLEFASPQDYDQYKVNQVIGNVGSGLELVLGDRDDFIQGSFRFYWMMDMPQMSPLDSTDLVDEDALVASSPTWSMRTHSWRPGVRTPATWVSAPSACSGALSALPTIASSSASAPTSAPAS